MASPDGQDARPTRLRSRSVSLPSIALRDVLRLDRPIHAVFTAPSEPTVVASGVAETVTAEGRDRFAGIRRAGDRVFDALDAEGPHAARPRFLGGFSFHDRHASAPPWEDFPEAWFVLPTVQFVLGDDGGWLTVTGAAGDHAAADLTETAREIRDGIETESTVAQSPGVAATERGTEYDRWIDQVEGALARIESGTLEKVTLAQTLEATLEDRFPLAGTLDRLGSVYPSCYRFAIRPGAARGVTPAGSESDAIPTFFGASPERLVTMADETLLTGALASTVARGETEAADAALADRLQRDEKFDREHAVVVESIVRQLEAVARDVRIGDRTIRRLDAVQHLFTPIEATADADHVLEAVTALHPTPAVGGLPPDEALDAIRRTETFDRGWYAAPIGWFDGAGDGTFAVGIRSAVAEDARATLFAGNGIVADADPDAEWNEVQLKYSPILDALR
ncbi:MAG: isochorismate synthase MenF [Halanaeroarchaeum sp.]